MLLNARFIVVLKDKVKTFKWGLLPLIIIMGIACVVIAIQPDTDTVIIIAVSGIALYLTAGGKWRHILILPLILSVSLAFFAFSKPYILQRVKTFINQDENPLTSGYQIQQSLIAIGSGGISGRGFGQSIQKFNFLPEPIGDSIFAVASEEFGFVGAVFIILLFMAFSIAGLKIAVRTSDMFGHPVSAVSRAKQINAPRRCICRKRPKNNLKMH